MNITYQTTVVPTTAEIIDVYNSSGLKRPTDDAHRIAKMYANSNLVVTAWEGELLVGVARSLTDFCYACYLSDLAVRLEYQKLGIGRQLINLTRQEVTEQSMLLLLSAPTAMEYYPKTGMDAVDNGFMIKRVG
jgi:predicted N-acetyltransferase YhbS